VTQWNFVHEIVRNEMRNSKQVHCTGLNNNNNSCTSSWKFTAHVGLERWRRAGQRGLDFQDHIVAACRIKQKNQTNEYN